MEAEDIYWLLLQLFLTVLALAAFAYVAVASVGFAQLGCEWARPNPIVLGMAIGWMGGLLGHHIRWLWKL